MSIIEITSLSAAIHSNENVDDMTISMTGNVPQWLRDEIIARDELISYLERQIRKLNNRG